MDSAMNVGLRDEIFAELKNELESVPTFNAVTLKSKVNDAYRKVRSRKAYENTSYDELQIEKDLRNRHFQDIKDVALYNYNKIGAEFQTSHNENSISRMWRTEDEVLGNIVAFVGFIKQVR